MKRNTNWIVRTLVGTCTLVLAATLQAQTMTRFEAQAGGSSVKIEGTSTIHDWDVKSQIIGGYLEIDSAFLQSPTAGKINAKVEVKIPVRSLKSYMTAMDEVMQEAMSMKQYPRIEYRISELTLKEAPKDAKTWACDAKGQLTVSGVTNTVSFPVTITRDADKLKVTSGKIDLKMTSFNIKPPAPKLGVGMIKTGDDVKVSFEWSTAKVDSK